MITPGVYPLDGIFFAGNSTGTTFKTSGVFYLDLSGFFIVFVKMARTKRKTIFCNALCSAYIVMNDNMALFVCLEGINGKFFINSHSYDTSEIFYAVEVFESSKTEHA